MISALSTISYLYLPTLSLLLTLSKSADVRRGCSQPTIHCRHIAGTHETHTTREKRPSSELLELMTAVEHDFAVVNASRRDTRECNYVDIESDPRKVRLLP